MFWMILFPLFFLCSFTELFQRRLEPEDPERYAKTKETCILKKPTNININLLIFAFPLQDGAKYKNGLLLLSRVCSVKFMPFPFCPCWTPHTPRI